MKRPEAVETKIAVGIPQIVAGEIDVLPADGGEVGEQRVREDFAAALQFVERPTEIHGIPERDRGGDEREPACTVLLRLGRAISQSAEAVKAHGAGEGVARLALIELYGGLPAAAREEPLERSTLITSVLLPRFSILTCPPAKRRIIRSRSRLPAKPPMSSTGCFTTRPA